MWLRDTYSDSGSRFSYPANGDGYEKANASVIVSRLGLLKKMRGEQWVCKDIGVSLRAGSYMAY